MISPVRYSGRSGSNSQARVNITAGPMTQFNNNDSHSERRSRTASSRRRYFTLASTGYIINSRPIAIGSDTVPILTRSSQSLSSGIARPSINPATIATPIHAGRNRSSIDSRCNTSVSSVRLQKTNHHKRE